MFDFQKLKVYQKARVVNKEIRGYIKRNRIFDPYYKDQLKRASVNIVMNIAEGSAKKVKREKINYYTLSREHVYECVSIIELLHDDGSLSQNKFEEFMTNYEELSKMLYGLIRSQSQ